MLVPRMSRSGQNFAILSTLGLGDLCADDRELRRQRKILGAEDLLLEVRNCHPRRAMDLPLGNARTQAPHGRLSKKETCFPLNLLHRPVFRATPDQSLRITRSAPRVHKSTKKGKKQEANNPRVQGQRHSPSKKATNPRAKT